MDWTLAGPLAAIIWIDLLLSGDNALVIAMVCRGLPRRQQRIGIVLGATSAVLLRIVMAFAIAQLMAIEGLRLAGGIILLVVAARMVWDNPGADAEKAPATTLLSAVVAIALADAGMSLDNVLAIAALSGGSVLLMALGVAISIPFVVAGAALVKAVLDRLPWLTWAGAGLLGWVAGDIISDDPLFDRLLHGWEGASVDLDLLTALMGAAAVLLIGTANRFVRHRA